IYLDIVAERTKIDAAVLQEELKRGESRYSGGGIAPSSAPAPQRPSASAHPPVRPSARATGAGDERSFLRALIKDEEWVARAMQDKVLPDWFDRVEYREIYQLLVAGRGNELPEALSPEGALAWAELKESAEQLDPSAVGDLYEASREALEARPQFREFEKLMKAIERAPAGAKDALITEREARRSALAKKYPAAWKRWYTRRGIK
ncbi:MAG TPA: hypothetical protein VG940_02195, partial [Gemmatimonadales bacterium]|nr:hypothetical protein [Gemmatimonadales bacterium]